MGRHRGELFARVGCTVTDLSENAKNVARFCNRRGDCERFIKEGRHALSWTRLSCCRFASNRVRPALFVLACDLADFFRRFALPREVPAWSLSSIQLKLVEIGAKASPMPAAPSSNRRRWRYRRLCSPRCSPASTD